MLSFSRTVAWHTFDVKSVTCSSDGSFFVSAGDNVIKCWSTRDFSCVKTFENPRGNMVSSVALTPNSRYLVSGGMDFSVKVWDLTANSCIHTLYGHSGGVRCVTVTGDGRRVVSGGDDQSVVLWDLLGGEKLRVFEGHRGFILAVTVTPDNLHIISASEDKTVKIWDLNTGACKHTLMAHKLPVSSLAVSPDSRLVFSASLDQSVMVWEVASGNLVRTQTGHQFPIRSLTMSADGRWMVSGAATEFYDPEKKGEIIMWETASGRLVRTFPYRALSLCFVPDGSRVICGSDDRSIKMYKLAKGTLKNQVLPGHSSHITTVALTPNCKYALSASHDSSLRVWDVRKSSCLHVLRGHQGAVTCIATTADSKMAVSGSEDATLRVWRVSKNGLFKKALQASELLVHTLTGHTAPITLIRIAGDILHSYDAQNVHKVWAIRTGECLETHANAAVPTQEKVRLGVRVKFSDSSITFSKAFGGGSNEDEEEEGKN
eukprot:GILI01007422.1.p1 GENE.GILI01007422.1~~GILI01007422.1.p1  ORF type:complete len:488 (+),score=54.60 GILI01007422.1:159-1622(+)